LGGGKLTSWGGQFYVAANSTVRRILPDGQQDPSFIGMNTGPYFSSGQGGDYHVYPDGRVLMTGVHVLSDSIRGFEGFYSLVWFSNTGYLDTTAIHRKCDGDISTIAQQPDGKFICSGFYSTFEGSPAGRILRTLPDGALDTTFSTDLVWGAAQALSVLPDGRILGSGYLLHSGTSDTLKIIRLLPDGTLDTTFNNQLAVTHDLWGSYLELRHRVLPDGRIVLLGQFDHVNGEPRGGVAILDADGELLNDAFTGAGCGEVLNSAQIHVQGVIDLVPSPDGHYYICGLWRGYDDGTVNDSTQRFVSRLYGLDVGVREVEKPLALQVVPNPSTGPVRVVLPEAIGPATLQVVDAQGRVVRVQRIAGGPAVLDLTGQAAGVYAVRVRTEAGRSGHARIVLQPGGR
jgi:uncharacterized delta-60 repeat protein